MDTRNNIKLISRSIVTGLSLIIAGCGAGSSTGVSQSSPPPEPAPVDGKGGSMARFTMVGDYLYTVSGKNIQLFNIGVDPAKPAVFAKVTLDWGIETLFSHNNHLYIGANDGVHILDNTNPESPYQVSKLLHVSSCDPVVVSGQYAYVTLHSGGSQCGAGVDQLDVIDIADPSNPQLVKTLPMQNPKGLGISTTEALLFVCDGPAGLKIFNLDNPGTPVYTTSHTDIDCYDVIVDQSNLVISDSASILQYQFTKLNMTPMSQIEIAQ